MKPVILCVDDTPSLLEGEKMLLEENGYRVLTATNGKEAVQAFTSHSVDLVLLDYYMPEMNGGMAAVRMKDSKPDVPVAILSSDECLPLRELEAVEAMAHNTQELHCKRTLESFPEIVSRLKSILERFMNALSCIDPCFIAQETLEQLPTPAQVGKTKVGGIDFNKPRMRWVAQAVLALSPSPGGFTAPQLAEQVRRLSQQDDSQYGSRRAAYDLKKLRGKQIVCRIGKTATYETIPQGARAMAALVVLRDIAIKPLLAAAQQHRRSRRPQNPSPLDLHYQTIRASMLGVFQELGIAA